MRGHLQIAGATTIRGGDGWPGGIASAFAGSGIFAQDANLRVLDGRIDAGQNGVVVAQPIQTSGAGTVLRVSPRVLVAGLSRVVMPGLIGDSAPPGGLLTATAVSENGDLVIVVIGLGGAPTFVPGIQDAFWLDPVVHLFHTIAVQTNSGSVTGTVAVPNTPGFLGLRLNWQAACYGPVTGLQASNPVTGLVR